MYVFILDDMSPSQHSSKTRRSQASRSEAMQHKLIKAATSCLVDLGYARTTAVEVCHRAGVTRGALFHHYDGLPHLLAAALEAQFENVLAPFLEEDLPDSLNEWLENFWAHINTPNFKAVLEIWLAARNDPDAMNELQPVIARIGQVFSPLNSPALQQRLAGKEKALAFYHTAIEAMFGLMLGRATSPGNAPLPHEDIVVAYLMREAKTYS